MPAAGIFPRKPRRAPGGKIFGGRQLRPLNSPPLSNLEAASGIDQVDGASSCRSQSVDYEVGRRPSVGDLPPPEPPKHAWWRGLLAWQGNVDGDLADGSYRTGGSCASNCMSPEESVKSSSPSLPPSQALKSADREISKGNSTTLTGPSTQSMPSNHLRWAKHVSACQKRWLHEHHALTKPRPRRASHKASKDAHQKLLQRSPIPPIREWPDALRDKEGLELPPADWQEKKNRRLKKQWALQRLKQQQLKWRQDHEQWEQRRRERLSDDSYQQEQEELEDEELGDEEEVGDLTPISSMMNKLPLRNDTPDSTHVPFLRTRASSRPTNLNMQLIDNGTKTPDSGGGLTPQSGGKGSGPSSPAYSEVSLGEHAPSMKAMPRNASWGSVGSGGRHGSAKLQSPPELVDDNAVAAIGSGGRASDGNPPRFNQSVASNVSSCRSTLIEADEHHRGSTGLSALSEIFDDGDLADARWTPSIVSGLSGAPSAVTSKRCSESLGARSPQNEADLLEEFDNMKKHSTIAEEEDEPMRRVNSGDEDAAFPPAPKSGAAQVVRRQHRRKEGQTALKQMTRMLTIETWEEWRMDFPLEVLNVLADFYESFTGDSEGRRMIGISQLEAVTSKVLGFPPKSVTQEAEAKGLAPPPSPHSSFQAEVLFTSLPHFFKLIRGTVERVETEEAEFLWSSDDLHQLSVIFHRHVNASGRLPVAHLFNVIADLGFDELNVSDVKEQKWLAGVTQEVIDKQKQRGRQTIADPSQIGSLSFQDLCRIVTAALHSKEKERRQLAFKAERHVRKEVGFSPIEMEDLRELHDTYLSVEVQGNNGALPRLLTLFHICSVRDLSHGEVDALKDTIAKNAPVQLPGEDSSKVSFPTFMLWMKDVFQNHIGDLHWHHHPAVVPGPDRKGFAAAMLRDQFRAAGMGSPKSVTGASGTESMSSTRRGSFDLTVPNSRRNSGGSNATPNAFNLGKMFSFSQSTSAMTSRHNSISYKVAGLDHLTPGGSKQQTPTNAGRAKSTTVSRWASRGNSRDNSRSGSRSNSIFQAEADDLQDREDQNHKAVFLMKGLPPQEAMLARKQYRAISVDLSNAGSTQPPAAPGPAMDAKVSEELAAALTAPVVEPQEKLPSLPPQPPSVEKAPRRSDGAPQSKSRSVKQGLDPDLLVTDAIAKLALVRNGDSPDLDDEQEAAMGSGCEVGDLQAALAAATFGNR